MRAYKFDAVQNPPLGEAAFVQQRSYGVIATDAAKASQAALRQTPTGWTLMPTGDTFDPPSGWKLETLYHIGDA